MARKLTTIRYIGEGAFLPGVPARDLTPMEWEQHKEAIMACPHRDALYEIPKEEEGVKDDG